MVGIDKKNENLVVMCLFRLRLSDFIIVVFDWLILGIIVRYWIILIVRVLFNGMCIVLLILGVGVR